MVYKAGRDVCVCNDVLVIENWLCHGVKADLF